MGKFKKTYFSYKFKTFNPNAPIENFSVSQTKIYKKFIRKKNPDIFHYNKYNSFIYQPILSSFYYDRLNDKNKMKLDKNEISFLTSLIESMKKANDNTFIYVLPFFKELLDNIKILPDRISKRPEVIKNIIQKIQTKS